MTLEEIHAEFEAEKRKIKKYLLVSALFILFSLGLAICQKVSRKMGINLPEFYFYVSIYAFTGAFILWIYIVRRAGSMYAKYGVIIYARTGEPNEIFELIDDYESTPGSRVPFMFQTISVWLPLAKNLQEMGIEPPDRLEEVFKKLDRNPLNLWWRPMRKIRQAKLK